MKFKSFIKFDIFITTYLIQFVYILSSLGLIIGVLFIPSYSVGLTLLMLVGGLIGIRFYCELIIVIFKIGANVSKLANDNDSDQTVLEN